MKIFRRKRVEEIDLKIKDTTEKEISEANQMYSETDEYHPKNNFFDSLLRAEKMKLFESTFQRFSSKHEEVLSIYYINKIFSPLASKGDDFLHRMQNVDQKVGRLQKENLKFALFIKEINEKNIAEDEINIQYEGLVQLLHFQDETMQMIDAIRKAHYSHLKIATVNVCMHKTSNELETLYKNLALFLNEYKNLTEAAEFVFFNSGKLIVKTVKALVDCLEAIKNKDHKDKYPITYFIKSDAIITLTLTEWIDLYQKLKFVTKLLNGVDLIQMLHYKNDAVQFEVRYLILMMHMETNSKSQKITQFHI